jgi:hypothetical protein
MPRTARPLSSDGEWSWYFNFSRNRSYYTTGLVLVTCINLMHARWEYIRSERSFDDHVHVYGITQRDHSFFFLPCRKLTWLEKWRNPVLVVVSPQMAKILLLPKISCRWLTSFTVQALCAHIVANHHLCLVSEGQEEREKKKMVQIPCTAPPYRTSTLDKNHVLKRAITRPRVIWFLVVSTST